MIQIEDPEETKKRFNEKTVESILSRFRTNFFAIHFYFEKFGNLAVSEDETAIKDSVAYIEKCFNDLQNEKKEIEEGKNASREDKFSHDQILKFARQITKLPKVSNQNYQILSRSSFLMLNNYFEYLLTDLLSHYYNKYQESLNERDFRISLRELNEFENIQDCTKELIQKEIESMIIDFTFPKLLEHFKDKLGIDLESNIIKWDFIEELRERRHLIVHNSSIVNKKYIVRTGNPYNLNIGDTVDITNEYFELAYAEFYLAGTILCYNCWGTWDKDRRTIAMSDILDELFEKLKLHQFDYVSRLTDYTNKIEPKNEEQENYLLRIKFNRCIALKHLEQEKILDFELRKIKVGTANPLFKLAHSILSDKLDKVPEYLKQTKSLGEITIDQYNEWPLFSFVHSNKELHQELIKILNN